MTSTIKHCRKGKVVGTIKRSGAARVEMGEMHRQSAEDFQVSENTPQDIMMIYVVTHFSELTEYKTPRVTLR